MITGIDVVKEQIRLAAGESLVPFHLKVLGNPFFLRGEVYTDFIERRMPGD